MTTPWRTHAPLLTAICGLGLIFVLAACKDSTSSIAAVEDDDVAPPPTAVVRNYNGTASVGDMLTISVDATALVITYENLTAGHSGTASYVMESDGSWTINDVRNGHLLKGYEIPNFALVLQVALAGPGADQPAIVTAIKSQSIEASDLAGSGLHNYMQFRTNGGGVELGWLDGEENGDMRSQYYWPYGGTGHSASSAAYSATDAFPSSDFVAGPENRYLIANVEPGEPPSYIFRTTGGFLAIDTPNGSLVCMQQAATSAFLDANVGTYKAFTYHKANAHGDSSGEETGTPSVSTNRVVFRRSTDVAHPERGHLTIYSPDGSTIIADTELMNLTDGGHVGAGKLINACNGLFTFTLVDGTRTNQIFVTFLTDTALIASFSYDSALPDTYSYFYGTALRVVAAGG